MQPCFVLRTEPVELAVNLPMTSVYKNGGGGPGYETSRVYDGTKLLFTSSALSNRRYTRLSI